MFFYFIFLEVQLQFLRSFRELGVAILDRLVEELVDGIFFSTFGTFSCIVQQTLLSAPV